MRGSVITLVITLLAFTSGCAAMPKGVDPAFEPLLREFKLEAAYRGKFYNLDSLYGVQFVPNYDEYEDGAQIIGMCEMPSRYITISAPQWALLNQAQKEETLFHEIGHCIMGLEHSSCPGVMCEYLSGGWVEPDRTSYLNTFFQASP